jgi:hypothetical protein
MRNVLNYLQGSWTAPSPASLAVLNAVTGNDLEHRFGVAAVVACSVTLIVTGALLAAGLKTGGDEAGW